LITEERIRKILSVAITDMSSTILSSFNGDLQTSITAVIDETALNLHNPDSPTQVEITSFEEEFTHLTTLANLNIDSGYFTYTPHIDSLEKNLRDLGASIDSICFNTTTSDNKTSYNEDQNSKLISRISLSNVISSAFATAEIDNPTQTIDIAFNNLISDIQSSITAIATENRVITWERELSYVSTLIQLTDPNAEEVELANVTEIVTPYLDKISFNEKDGNFADVTYQEVKYGNENITGYIIVGVYETSYIESDVTKYYNSVIIKRSMIKSLMTTILSDFIKTGDPLSDVDTISNELVNNLNNKVNITNTINEDILFSNYTDAFDELNSVKDQMEAESNYLSEITSYKDISEDDLTSLDEMLTNFQDTKISGVVTTRKIALMILDRIEDILTKTDNILVEGTPLHTKLYDMLGTLEDHNDPTNEYYETKEMYNISSLYEEIENIPDI